MPEQNQQQNDVTIPDVLKQDYSIKRTKTGVPGLDRLCDGGYEKDSSVLIMGNAGAGKTTMLTQFIYTGAVFYDEPGVYISFEEPKNNIIKHCKAFGWEYDKLEAADKLAVINYKPHEIRKLTEEGGGLIWDTITEIGAQRVAIDSLTSYVVLFGSEYQAREAQLGLFELVRKWNCTTLFSGEGLPGTSVGAGMEGLTDAVIALHHPRRNNVRIRAMEIYKMRGTNHSQKICPFEIVPEQGLIVYPSEDIFEEF